MRHVIVGASAAGFAAAEAIRKRDPTAEIVMLSDEPHPPYYRPLIPYLIHDGKPEGEIIRVGAGLAPAPLAPAPAGDHKGRPYDVRLNTRGGEPRPGETCAADRWGLR